MSSKNNIEKIRAFNRLYMPFMNLLGNNYLGSEYSITEARIFFEIYENEGCNAAYIAKIMNIDKSYLSRIIKAHEEKGYISRVPSTIDRRSYSLFLTTEGKQRAKKFIKDSNKEIGNILQRLSDKDEECFVNAIDTIIKILSKEKDGDLQ
ncbi:MAG: MarR family transcriptional regulator [Massilioclostridium sp.]|nr:MarR family transcriptional regulator [Massilioclostridium sp.]